MPSFTLTQSIDAPPETVFDVLADHRGMPKISAIRRVDIEKEGDPAPGGLGTIRVLHLAGPPVREEIVAYEPPTHFAYKILKGAPVRDHLGDVTLEKIAGGTFVTYRTDVKPVPVAGHAFAGMLRAVAIPVLLRGLKKESERRAASAA
jgi:uncharacterized protein YndB with AHSA1/START domain